MGWSNWSGNQRTDPVRTVAAADTAAVVAAVRAAAADGLRVKAIGSGHSFTGVGVPEDVAVRVPSDPSRVRVAGELVTVPAGITLRVLNDLLWAYGRALPNLGDIDAQTVAGAISTGTHGTGGDHRGIAAQVRGLELVTADGTVLTCTPEENADVLHHARVGLGALGVLTEVTLATVPAFHLRASEECRPLGPVLDAFDELVAAHDHVDAFWFPHTDTVTVKCNDRTGAAPDRRRIAAWVGEELLQNGAFALTCRAGTAVPRLVPALNRLAAGQMSAPAYVERSYRVFTVSRRVRFLEMEYAVPRTALREAFDGLRAAAARHARGVTFPVEIRVAAADDIPLSTACGRDSAYLAVHVQRGHPYEAYFGAVERVLAGLDGRPHWAKIHTGTAETLRRAYPGFDGFLAVRDRIDPDRRFTNPYLERVLG